MNRIPSENKSLRFTPYLTALGVFALAFGCSVGQGAFVMPGGVFLPIAGPVGTAIGIALGAAVMLVLAKNYHYLMNRFPDSGGTYTYTKKCFGYDHGFLSAWFLILTYIAILWANATALPVVARTLFGSTFQFGFHYEIAGFDIYFGEILVAVGALAIAAFICLRRSLAARTQIVMALLLAGGVIFLFIMALLNRGSDAVPLFDPPFAGEGTAAKGIFTIFALAPWAYAGFESVSHSAAEAKYPLKKTFRILAISLAVSAVVYAMLAMMATTYAPAGNASWSEYVANLGNYSGMDAQPTFYAAQAALGGWGKFIIGIAALCGIFTGLIGNYIALSRLVRALTEDGMLPEAIGKLDKNLVPRRVILGVLGVSVILPFFGRTAIAWIVDATTVGATIAYAFSSAAAFKIARTEKSKSGVAFGLAGLLISLFFACAFLIPNLISVKTLATESYLILAAWGLLGFIVFLALLRKDKERRLGRSNVALIVMLAVIIFTSSVWMRQITSNATEASVTQIQNYYNGVLADAGVDVVSGATRPVYSYLHEVLDRVDTALWTATSIQILLIVTTLIVLFVIYARIQKREKEIEVEKALAEESSRAKTSFLSNMSHEIRTPMNAIIGLDNIALRDPELQPKTREHLEKIGASARHLLGLINDILDMSRIESGRMVLKDEEFSSREFLDQVNIIVGGQCADKGLRYECSIIGDIGDYYVGDDMKLKQVLINILGNSVKFTEAPGDVTLTVEQIDGQTDGQDGCCTLQFTMRDTGIGMDKEFIPKIFEAFSQEDATTTNKYGGSGLGMAITKNFVTMMGGDIKVESEKGVGSVFTVTVKLKPSERRYAADGAAALPAGMRALVVDDDEIACEHARLVLKTLGVKADTLTSPEAALERIKEYFEKEPYTLLLTDYKMPVMNGQELTRAVRAFDGGRTGIIMLTGYNWDIIEEEVHKDGVDCVMAKPIFTENLLRAIRAVLDLKSGAAPAAPEPEKTAESVLAGRRVLMAEDVDANAEILADLLDLEEILSERACNGKEAVRMFAESDPGYYDAILMDVRMPEMDGLEATRTIRAMNRTDAGAIPIIAMTANVFDEDVQRSHEAGMNAHLSKPVEPDKLYAKLAELIGS
ncbi:MAG: amino acid permease [Clostridia bacterium]|nr:amino acid permease [Clostridia bacterium]